MARSIIPKGPWANPLLQNELYDAITYDVRPCETRSDYPVIEVVLWLCQPHKCIVTHIPITDEEPEDGMNRLRELFEVCDVPFAGLSDSLVQLRQRHVMVSLQERSIWNNGVRRRSSDVNQFWRPPAPMSGRHWQAYRAAFRSERVPAGTSV